MIFKELFFFLSCSTYTSKIVQNWQQIVKYATLSVTVVCDINKVGETL